MLLDRLYTHPKAAPRLRSSPLGQWLDSFVDGLANLGYTPWSCRSNVILAADLGRWMATNEISVGKLGQPAIDAYLNERKTQRERRRAASSHMLAHLRQVGVAPLVPVREDMSPITKCVKQYETYLRKERGAAAGTIEGYVAVVREFLIRCFGTGGMDVALLTASDIGEYLTARAPGLSPKRVVYLACALRSFLRFLFLRGEITTDLSTAALTAQLVHRASVPRYLTPAEVKKLLDTCNLTTTVGRRNRAILLLLVRLGLRAAEVAALELDDIRWRSGELVVRGKGDVLDRLPLVSEVGDAISAYLINDRPADVRTRKVFLRLCAPIRALGGRSPVSTVVRVSIKKAGLHPSVRGAHLLRHTLGTQMIRNGATMAEIAEVLRHYSPRSSAIYAKVDFESLRVLAQHWPGKGGTQ